MLQKANKLNSLQSIVIAACAMMVATSSCTTGCANSMDRSSDAKRRDPYGRVIAIDMAHGVFIPSLEEGSSGQLIGNPALLPTKDHDAELRMINDPSHVVTCDLTGATLTRATMEVIARCTSLRELNLSGTNASDQNIAQLSHLHALQTLHLSGTGVTDVGVNAVGAMPNLEIVSLDNISATEKGVERLLALPRLRVVYCRGIHLSPDFLKRATQARPDVTVVTDLRSGQVI